jgi:1-acyl-sn-glycerol-3-phosphate acyltransferase
MAKIKNKDGFFRGVWHNSIRYIVVMILWTLYKVRVYGQENVPDKGAILVLSNHQSFYDTIICQGWARRTFYYVPRASLFHGFWGWIIDSLYTIPIDQEHAALAGMRAIIDVLKRGKAVCLYPEGARTTTGRIDQIKPGFSLLVRRSGAVVVPMVIEGLCEIWPRGQKYPRIGKRLPVGVMYGKPITAEYIKEVGEQQFMGEFNHMLQAMHNDLRAKMGRPPIDYEG